ncbi:GNAT family protein [Pseudalkalibacillus sp. SCS-8]|uniref:GNAT family N-acetyltransferase n=1 Tax=Pseudalkalibacillus nanhaiensis TaxID=3115291 RepID=UPI0032DBA20C
MEIRHITESDAEAFLQLNKQLDRETKLMLFEADERMTTVEEQARKIRSISHDPYSTIFVIEEEKKLIGFIVAIGSPQRRKCHSVYIATGILQEWTGQGLGTLLFERLEQWAKEQGVHRLELTVMKHNEAGVALYKKAGFEIEGVKRHSMKVDGEFVDEYYMAKLI